MYVERVKYKVEANDEWETGYYIAKCYNANESIILTKEYKPVGKVWDFMRDTDNILRFAVDEKEDFEEVVQPKFKPYRNTVKDNNC